ncbi:MAG: amino acid adenylation domain-containing protein [Candidatus Aminicenantes bacterium]|nr:amino acid adenylation domain-containing protein [Candidatus Aminicenantes bacterium]NIM82449.1 amino acid adenylation domain-containing protein [Candidatus Aminicenantes bacterium]NIN21810.1 amino acid adenylation domain-containing protein [Candidatus Aminicenantes bacterium]NIN45602.1 amino acid adenylation domain-containing protein [Candidatus Aminicenantes bacterium]NIN88433.1 amino acid adenylation domain-containing protein [Candidatus Aminicenantes bacterium]
MKSYDIAGEEKYIGGQNTRERDFWLTQLSGVFEKSFFPYDYERAANKELQMAVVPCGLPGSLEAKLIKASTGSDSRLHMLLVASLVLLLGKYTGTRDITIGVPIYRQEQEGDFVNTALTLRHQLEDHMTFKDLLIQVRQTITQANENANYPIESLPYELGMSYSTAEDFPLFDVMLLLENVHNQNHIRHFHINMMFLFNRTGEKLSGKVEYNSSLYNKKMVERIVNHYIYLLQEALFNPNTPIADISVLSEEEKEKILFVWNDTDTGYPKEMTIQQLFEKQVETTPHHIAVVSGPQQVTYKKLNEQANRTAAVLIKKGIDVKIKGNIIVGIMGQRSVWMVSGILGILKAGGVYLPINAKDPGERIRFILEDSKAGALITREHLVEINPSLLAIESLGNIILFEELADEGEENIDPHVYKNRECLNKPGDNICLIYTSGTTGKPKGVLVKQQGVVNYVWWAAKQYVKNEKVNFPLHTSIAFDLTVTSLFTPLITGNAIVVYGDGAEANEALIEKVMEDNQVAVVKLTPSHLKLIKDRNTNERISSVKRFILGGEQLSTQLVKDVYRAYQGKVEIYNEYGPTEAAVGCMIYQFNPHEESAGRKSVPIGKPIANSQVYLLNENQEPVPMGAVGELYISGEGLAAGYLCQPGLTAEKFIPNPFIPGKTMYRTGDLAKWVEDGNIEFLSRKDNQVKIRGYRIELVEIENCLLTHDEIREVVVISREDNDEDMHLCAYLVSDRKVPVVELREYLAAQLPDYMIPAYFVTIDQVPLTRNGKIDTRALPEPKVNVGVEYIAPRDETERRLVKIWSDILSIDETELSIDVNFFEVGGHSLKATVLANKIHKNFNAKVSLESIFRFPTLRGLGEYLKDAERDDFNAVEVVEQKEYYGLSSAQMRQYLLQQMDPSLTNYHIIIVQLIEGALDRTKLEETLKGLIRRHESLRTSFHMLKDQPVQKINNDTPFALGFHEMDKEKAGKNLDNFIRPYDLSKAPLFQVECIKIEEERHILMLDMHHIISDAVSMQLFIKDFIALYGGEEPPPLRLQYKDFSEWQDSEKEKEAVEKQKQYWLNEFEGEIPVLNIPSDYSRPERQSFEGSVVCFEIGKGETQALKEIALDQGATLFMMLLAVFNVFLAKISGQDDIIIGTPTTGRRHENLERIIGMFVNTLALRNYPGKERTFREFLVEIAQRTLEAFENQDYQYEELVEQVAVKRDVSRNPLVDVMFMFDVVELSLTSLSDLRLKPYEYTPNTSRFDLFLLAEEKNEMLLFTFTYCTKLFKNETIKRFIEYFKNIVFSVLSNPDQEIGEIELITDREKRKVLYDFNDNGLEYPVNKTIPQLFEEQAAVNAGKPAVQFENDRLTYEELNEKANQLAWVLRMKGVIRHAIVGIIGERTVETIIGIMAILKAGGAYMPIDPGCPKERLKFFLEDSNTNCLLGAKLIEEYREENKDICEFIDLSSTDIYMGNKEILENVNTSGDLAYVIFTSGSTGKPKGVKVEHRNVINLVYGLKERIYKEPGQNLNVALLSPFAFDASVKQIFGALLQGLCLCIVPEEVRFDGGGLVTFYHKYKIGISDGTPTHITLLLESININNRTTDFREMAIHLLIGGEALPLKTTERFFNVFGAKHLKITNVYGPTECSVDAACFEINAKAIYHYGSIPIGKPMPNQTIYILDNRGQLQPIGIPGDLCISGDGVARGYLNNPELTAEKFINNPFDEGNRLYKTGDYARWFPDGNIEFLGRIDKQVKIRGYRIELGEIENLLLVHDEIKEAVVVAKAAEDKNGDRYLCAYFVSTRDLSASELVEYLAGNLPGYMIPAYFVPMEKMPLTPNGKVNIRELPESEINAAEEYEAPQGETEERLVRIWSEVLGTGENVIGRDANFFELGGHSLKATIIISRIRKEFDVLVPMQDFFKQPVIKGLAAYIKMAAPGRYQSIEPVEEKEYYSLSSQQLRLFSHQERNPGSTVYNIMAVVEIEGDITAANCQDILRKLVKRHESLRSSFETIDDEPVQRIHHEVEFEVDHYTVENETAQIERSEKIKKILKRFVRAFDLRQAPLLRVGLIKLGEKKYIFMLDIHHIITDGTSNLIFTQELISLREGKELPPLKIHYKDYSEGLNSGRKEEELRKQKKYWLKQFEGDLPILDLPIDFERPSIQNFEGRMINFEMCPERTKALKALANKEGVTLYTLLLTIYYILLSKLSHQEDIIIGTPIAGRTHAQLEGIIGFFINTLGLRNFPRKEKTFKAFLKEVKERTLGAFENQDYQFEDLVKQVLFARDTSRNPLFDTMFVWQNIDIPEVKIPGLQLKPYAYEGYTSMFDLTLFGNETNHRLNFLFQYNITLFKEETIRRFGNYFQEIVSSILENKEVELADIKLSHDFIASTSKKPTIEFSF